MNQRKFRTDMARLVRAVRADIADDYRASDGSDVPGICLTVGADRNGWSFQTGDNSFTGGAYGYACWAVTDVFRDSNSYRVADDIIGQLVDLGAFDKEVQS